MKSTDERLSDIDAVCDAIMSACHRLEERLDMLLDALGEPEGEAVEDLEGGTVARARNEREPL